MSKSNNMGRLTEDMKRELIEIIRCMKDPRISGLLTLTRLDLTPDLDLCKVYISVLGEEGAAESSVSALNHAAGHIRSEVAKKMHIRKTPAYRFVLDEGAAYATHINQILEELNHDGND